MCHYSDIFGSGDVLVAQLLTMAAIFASIWFWAGVYRSYGVALRHYMVPLALWIAFGALDIVITTRGTFADPGNEGNPLARVVFEAFGYFGPAVASVLWIALWSLTVLVIDRRIKRTVAPGLPFPLARFLSLAIFYSLAVGHMRGFSSWFVPLCQMGRAVYDLLPGIPERFIVIVFFGTVLAALHAVMSSIWVYDNERK